MKKILFSIFAAMMAIGFVGCEYDDSEIVGRVENLEQRVLTLEQLCQQMNTNITAMQAIINALQTQDYITAVTPITQGSKTVGYTITFAKGDPITIYHGQDGKDGADGEDGKDGYTPVIGVDQDEDGKYYWTLDGEWMTDKEGNKIPATGKDGQDGKDGADGKDGNDGKDGTDGKDGENGKDGADGKDGENGKDGADGKDGENGKDGADGKDGNDGKDGQDGKDGITPQLDIRSGYWYISYDNGVSWERLGRATGYDGQDGQDGQDGAAGAKGDSMFKSVDASNDKYVIFILSDNTEIKVPKWVELTVTMNPIGTNEPYNGQQVQTMFTINDKDADYVVICDCPNINVGNDVSNITEGVITITIPNDAKAGDVIKVSVLATKNGLTAIGTTKYEVLPTDENYINTFTAGKLVLNQDVSLASTFTIASGNEVELDLNGNKISNTSGGAIENNGKLTIKGGTIEGGYYDSASSQKIYGIKNTGELTIDDNAIVCPIENTGTLRFNSGKIDNTDSNFSGIQSYSGNVILEDDVEINSARHAFDIEGGTATINGGTYMAQQPTTIISHHALNVGGESTTATVTINGGTFVGPNGNTSTTTNTYNGCAVMVQKNGTVTINDGNFSKGLVSKVVKTHTSSDGTLILKGGTYDEEPSSTYIATGYKVQANGGTSWGVIPD